MSVGDGPTMEVISLISASIVARHIINVHLWRERERGRKKKAVAFASQLLQRCHFLSAGFLCPPLPVSLCLHAASPSPRCAPAIRSNMHVEKDGKTHQCGVLAELLTLTTSEAPDTPCSRNSVQLLRQSIF